MPIYQFECHGCDTISNLMMSMKAEHPKKCPRCKSDDFHRIYTEPNAIVRGLDSAKTFGQAAEENAKRLGKEQLQLMADADRDRLAGVGAELKLPKGAKRVPKEKAVTPPWRDGSMGCGVLDKPLDVRTVKDVKKFVETGEK